MIILCICFAAAASYGLLAALLSQRLGPRSLGWLMLIPAVATLVIATLDWAPERGEDHSNLITLTPLQDWFAHIATTGVALFTPVLAVSWILILLKPDRASKPMRYTAGMLTGMVGLAIGAFLWIYVIIFIYRGI